jgi:hypothetical protein
MYHSLFVAYNHLPILHFIICIYNKSPMPQMSLVTYYECLLRSMHIIIPTSIYCLKRRARAHSI